VKRLVEMIDALLPDYMRTRGSSGSEPDLSEVRHEQAVRHHLVRRTTRLSLILADYRRHDGAMRR
jgi:hypothetical protein